MKSLDVKTAALPVLIATYRAAAVNHGAANENGDSRTANRNHDVIADVYRELRIRGDEAVRELLPLLDYIDPHVRAWAAAHALEFAPDRGVIVLQRLASSGRGVLTFTAEMTLETWNKGELRFP